MRSTRAGVVLDSTRGRTTTNSSSTGTLPHWLGEVTRSDHREMQNSDCFAVCLQRQPEIKRTAGLPHSEKISGSIAPAIWRYSVSRGSPVRRAFSQFCKAMGRSSMEPGPARPEGLLFEAGTKKTQRSDVSRRNGCEMVYGVVMTVFTAAASEGKPCVAMKKLWSYILRYMRPAISAALGPKVGRPPCRKTTTTTRPTLVLA
jgi:hypothetical protein